MGANNVIAYIALGSNLKAPPQQLLRALIAINHSPGIHLMCCSSFYTTTPIGYNDQPDFINAVAQLTTQLSAHQLLKRLQWIETKQARVRSDNQNAPRTLDLDILLYGQSVIKTENLTVPHPRMCQRRFVLTPLAQLNAKLKIPKKGRLLDYLAQVKDQRCVPIVPAKVVNAICLGSRACIDLSDPTELFRLK